MPLSLTIPSSGKIIWVSVWRSATAWARAQICSGLQKWRNKCLWRKDKCSVKGKDKTESWGKRGWRAVLPATLPPLPYRSSPGEARSFIKSRNKPNSLCPGLKLEFPCFFPPTKNLGFIREMKTHLYQATSNIQTSLQFIYWLYIYRLNMMSVNISKWLKWWQQCDAR